jgi:hypothetical protein
MNQTPAARVVFDSSCNYTPKMEAVWFSEMLVSVCHSAWRNVSEDKTVVSLGLF